VETYIRSGCDEGACLAVGGGRPKEVDRGWYVEPTVFTGVDNSMTIAREEIFGPVLCVIDYEDEREAISIANDSPYGLGGAIFTTDLDHGLRVAEQIQTGTCHINEAPSAGGGGPFGGVKHSGVGREYGREGFDSYFELKSIALPRGFTPAT
jgi:betaine-aldehyde dehydrogenase